MRLVCALALLAIPACAAKPTTPECLGLDATVVQRSDGAVFWILDHENMKKLLVRQYALQDGVCVMPARPASTIKKGLD